MMGHFITYPRGEVIGEPPSSEESHLSSSNPAVEVGYSCPSTQLTRPRTQVCSFKFSFERAFKSNLSRQSLQEMGDPK